MAIHWIPNPLYMDELLQCYQKSQLEEMEEQTALRNILCQCKTSVTLTITIAFPLSPSPLFNHLRSWQQQNLVFSTVNLSSLILFNIISKSVYNHGFYSENDKAAIIGRHGTIVPVAVYNGASRKVWLPYTVLASQMVWPDLLSFLPTLSAETKPIHRSKGFPIYINVLMWWSTNNIHIVEILELWI